MSNNSSENEATQKTNILKEVYLQKRKLLTQEKVDRKLEERKNFILRAAQTEEDLINATYRMTVKKLIEDYGQALVALKQSVLDKLDDERSQIEDEYLNDDIADDRKGTAFVSQKRKLRRRAAEDGSPTKEIAVDERPPMMVHQLSEESIMQDIMAIRRNMASSRLPKQAIQFQLPNLPSTSRSTNHFDLNDLNLDDDDAVDKFLRERLNINFPEN
ncbi:Sin3 histone deacetylase corepressor complex component SDS3 [Trichinella spiralis]|uniref:Sin3 histone deacetylase corepressor complex component SDS3 n=1 Tax=Trichinella spiralis TaxID=6334 RepID=A0ABR3KC41_TRISP